MKKGRRLLSALLSVMMMCGGAAGRLPVLPVQPLPAAAVTAEKAPEPEQTAPAEQTESPEETGLTDTAGTTVTTVTTADDGAEPVSAVTTVTTADSSEKAVSSRSKSVSSTITTTATAKPASSTKKSTSSTAKSSSTTTTTTTTAVSSSTKKSTSSTAKSSSTTATTAAMSSAESAVQSTAESTTEPVLHPTLVPMLKSSFPGGSTALTLWLTDNPGVQALGLSLRLPDVLKPHILEDGSPEITEDALTGRSIRLYNAEKNIIALDYMTDGGGSKSPVLCTIPLDISDKAVIGQKYTIVLTLDSISLAQDAVLDPGQMNLTFQPTAPLQRTLPAELTMTEQDGTAELLLSPLPPKGACRWESSAPDIVSVDENGVLTALKNGTADITVFCETLVYHCKVTAALHRDILPDKLTLTKEAERAQLSLSPVPHSSIVWNSADESVLTVDETGMLTAVENGTAEITAECEGMTYSLTVCVSIPMSVSLTAYTAGGIGETVQLSVRHQPAGGTVRWESSAPEVAAVDETGLVTFTGFGTAEIAAVCGKERVICTAENPEYLFGDVDGDGKVTAFDASLALTGFNEATVMGYEPEERTLTPLQEKIADVDGDGLLTAFDATCILTYTNLKYNAGFDDLTWEDVLPE